MADSVALSLGKEVTNKAQSSRARQSMVDEDTWQEDCHKFVALLVCRASSRLTRTTNQDSLSQALKIK